MMMKSKYVEGLADMLETAAVVSITKERAKLAMPTGATQVQVIGVGTLSAVVSELRERAEDIREREEEEVV